MNQTSQSYQVSEVYEILRRKNYYLSIHWLKSLLKKLRKQQEVTNKKKGKYYHYNEQDVMVIIHYLSERNNQLRPDYIEEHYFTLTIAAEHLKNTPYTRKVLLG
ncbi:MAG: hypothetical protein K0Q73_2609, partial [Paenibacillus sp.]|nr:hypothetical protein [Paenibacillus sp.]